MDGSKSPHPSGQRAQNERRILSLIQRHAALPGSEIARMADLSPQAVSVILRSLESDGLVIKGTPQRGRVGKPSVPMELNPCGAYAFGLKIGRRSAELALMDLTGALVAERRLAFAYPLPDPIFEFLQKSLAEMTADLPERDRSRIAGLGIAAPYGIWNWHDRIGAPEAELAAWKGLDLIQYCTAFTDLPIWIVNDATAACWAEQVFGRGSTVRDYAYFFLGTFAGGGVVLNGAVVEGRTGNAGAFGSLQVPAASGQSQQLIEAASLYLLEDQLKSAGHNPAQLWQMPLDWSQFAPHVESWTQSAAEALAHAAAQVCAVIDFQAVLIDGAMPSEIRSNLVNRTRAAFDQIDTRGVTSPQIDAAGLGGKARVLGAACGPIFAKFF